MFVGVPVVIGAKGVERVVKIRLNGAEKEMLAKSIAVDYAAHGIRSNAVCPGFVETPLTQWRLDIPELRKEVEARIPMDRVAQPEDIADAIAVLAAGRMSYMTGHALIVDGGWTAQ